MGEDRGDGVSCRIFHKWERWKIINRGPGKVTMPWGKEDSDVEVARLERFCARCGELQLKTVLS